MKGKIIAAALTFFLAAFLIYRGVRFILEIWWALALLVFIILAAIIAFRLWRHRKQW